MNDPQMHDSQLEKSAQTAFDRIYQQYDAMCQNPLLLIPADLKDERSTITLLGGGRTNKNFLIESPGLAPKYVLHVLNPGLGHYLDRPVFRPQSLPGPRTILATESILLEEFVQNKGPLTHLTQSSLEHLAKVLVMIHQTPKTIVSDENSSLEPRLIRFLRNIRAVEQDVLIRISELEDKNYYAEVVGELVNDSNSLLKSLSQLPQDIVFCHNDISLSNVLELETDEDRQRFGGPFLLVDYEYAGWNYRFFDIANFLHESECRSYDDAPYFDLIDEFHQGATDDGEPFLKEYYRQSAISLPFIEFAAFSRKFKIYSLHFWLLRAIHEAPWGWKGTRRYVEQKVESYRRLRDRMFSHTK